MASYLTDITKHIVCRKKYYQENKMGALTILLEDPIRFRLKVQADRHGCTVEDEARSILEKSLAPESHNHGLGTLICQRFRKIGGVELDIPSRSLPRLTGLLQDSDAP
jgi:plasmid stability protein